MDYQRGKSTNFGRLRVTSTITVDIVGSNSDVCTYMYCTYMCVLYVLCICIVMYVCVLGSWFSSIPATSIW